MFLHFWNRTYFKICHSFFPLELILKTQFLSMRLRIIVLLLYEQVRSVSCNAAGDDLVKANTKCIHIIERGFHGFVVYFFRIQ